MASELFQLLSSPVAAQSIFLHHPHHPTSFILTQSIPANCSIARIDTVEHYNPRLFFSGILNRFRGGLKSDENQYGEVSNWDAFSEGLRNLAAGKGKGKGKAKVEDENRLVVIVTKAERLRNVLGPGWSVLTRLSEVVSTHRLT